MTVRSSKFILAFARFFCYAYYYYFFLKILFLSLLLFHFSRCETPKAQTIFPSTLFWFFCFSIKPMILRSQRRAEPARHGHWHRDLDSHCDGRGHRLIVFFFLLHILFLFGIICIRKSLRKEFIRLTSENSEI